MNKLMDENKIKELMEKYNWSREEIINGYTAFSTYGSSFLVNGAMVIETIGDLEDEFDYGFVNGDFSACRQAELDGVKFINDINGLEKGCYIDTPENRELCAKALVERPEYRIENWLYKNEVKEYRDLYISHFGDPLENDECEDTLEETIISFLEELEFPYDDFCVNYIANEFKDCDKVIIDDIRSEWLCYVQENLFS